MGAKPKKRRHVVASKPTYSPERPLELAGELLTWETLEHPAPLTRRILARFAHFVPSHTDTQRGRRSASQLRVGLVVAGGICCLVGQATWLWIIGLVVACGAILLPVAAITKRTWISQLRQKTSEEMTIRRAVSVCFDGRRVLVRKNGKIWRRVLTRSQPYTLVKEPPWLGILPDSARRSDAVWLVTEVEAPSREEADHAILVQASEVPALVDAIKLA